MFSAATATWGISGTSFLLGYVALSGGCLVAVLVGRQRLRGSGLLTQRVRLDECELAMLNGGPRLTVMAAAARLRETGVLLPVGRGRVELQHRPKSHSDRVEIELYDALSQHPTLALWRLSRRMTQSDAVRDLRERLVAQGLMLDRRRETRAHRLWLLMLLPLALGIARLIAGIENQKPIGDLVIALCLNTIVAVWLARSGSAASPLGESALRNERVKHRNWESAGDLRPSLVVALFGPSVLWKRDPGFAAAWRVTPPGLGNWKDAYLPERPAIYVDGGVGGGGLGDGGGG